MYGEYESETLEKLHNAELSMLKDFAKLCDDNNIEYFARLRTIRESNE